MIKHIKEASYRHEMKEYITFNAKWESIRTFDLVDWPARTSAFKKIRRDNKITTFKLEFGLFATMHKRSRYEKEISSLCPRCNQVDETFDHALQCRETRLKTMELWKLSKQATSVPYTCPAVVSAIDIGITSWLDGQLVPVDAELRHPKGQDRIGILIARAVECQDQIGWGQAIRGRLSRAWNEANNQYRRERFNMASPIPWSANTIFQMWRFGISCWIARNEFVYGMSEQEKMGKQHANVNFEIKARYLLDCNKVNDEDRHLFDLRLEKRLAQNLEQKQLWISSVKMAILAHSRVPSNEEVGQNTQSYPQQSFQEIPPPIQSFEGRRPRVRLRP
jgi:hypothetical protein